MRTFPNYFLNYTTIGAKCQKIYIKARKKHEKSPKNHNFFVFAIDFFRNKGYNNKSIRRRAEEWKEFHSSECYNGKFKQGGEELSKLEEKVEELVTPKINSIGYRVYDVMYVKEGKDNYLRIFIDNDEGISLNDCEKVNDAITYMLDEANYIKDQYFLEISSPGVERNIRKNEHLQESLGMEITVKLFKPIEKKKEYNGILKSFSEEVVTLIVENEEVSIPRNIISSMNRTFHW